VSLLKYCTIPASLLLAFVGGLPAFAQDDQNMPRVEIESTSVMLGVGKQSGDGVLRLPNLGTNCAYPFKVSGFGAGIQVSVSRITASGVVKNLTQISDLSGDYIGTQGESTLVTGAGAMSMKNRNNNVLIDLESRTKGVGLGVGAQGLTVSLNEPPVNAPRIYVFDFGSNKTWVDSKARTALTQLVNAWKCHYVNFELVGHTDTVGKEGTNIEISEKRAKSVRDYLLGAGIAPTRITTRAAGESEPIVPTGQDVRVRGNRAVVALVR
jgi:outer membrane protein OmpA-like peptidoglycan-associated protein